MAPQRPLPALFSRSVIKLAPATGAALLALAFVTPVIASASTHFNVPCSGAGGGASGLVAAINAANSSGGGTIDLVQGCTYTLLAANNTGTITMPGMPGSPSVTITWGIGLPVIKSKITIDGSGGDNQQQGQSDSSGATIAGNGKDFAIFEVDGPGGNLTLNDLTITKGFSAFAGGALLNAEGSVTLNQSRVIGNVGAFGGGGIASGVIDPNHLGPIGTLTLNSSQVDGNTALSGGGGGVANHAGTLILNHSQVNNNTSGGGGGGISSGPGNGGAAGSSTLIVNLSQVNHNVSNGGAMAGAGGIANGGVATITHSQVDDNSAPGASGGGILNHGTMTIEQSQVNGNQALNNSITDGVGGGIANISFGPGTSVPSGVLTLDHSQVNNNTASGPGGGIVEVGFSFTAPNAPPLLGPGGPLRLDHSTVMGNSAKAGGGIFAFTGSPVTLVKSRIRDNTPDNCSPPGVVPGCVG